MTIYDYLFTAENTENAISFSTNIPHIEIKCIKPLYQQRCWKISLLDCLLTISRG